MLFPPSSCLSGLGVLALAAPLLAQDPWSRVPAFPVGCYHGADNFDEDVEALRSSLLEAREKQRERNEEIRQQFRSLDASQLQAKLMAVVQKNPAGAEKMFRQMQAMSSDAAAENPETLEKEKQHLEQLKQVRAAYQADYDRQLGPYRKVFQDMIQEKATQPQVDAAFSGFNRDYPLFCKKWFSPARLPNGAREGQLLTALDRYQEFLRTDWTKMLESKDQADIEFMQAVGIATTGYASTTAMEVAYKYLGEVEQTYRNREEKPRAP